MRESCREGTGGCRSASLNRSVRREGRSGKIRGQNVKEELCFFGPQIGSKGREKQKKTRNMGGRELLSS